jgi:hypothetical protein
MQDMARLEPRIVSCLIDCRDNTGVCSRAHDRTLSEQGCSIIPHSKIIPKHAHNVLILNSMRITIRELRQVIRDVLMESPWDFKHDVAAAWAEEEALKAAEKKEKRAMNSASFSQVEDGSFNDQIAEKQEYPEFQSVEAFVNTAIEDIETPSDEAPTFSATDLHALARNIFGVAAAGVTQLRQIRTELEGFGLRYVPREAIKAARGVTSNPHGRNPFADMGGGGSGFSSGGLKMGGGPGTMGAGTWDPESGKSFGMGAGKRKIKDKEPLRHNPFDKLKK